MSSLVHLTLACGDYDLHRGLAEGAVTPQGIDLTVLRYNTPPRQWRMDRHSEFDVCEFSMSSYLLVHDQQASGIPMTMEPVKAIPVFPHRRFRHSSIYVNTAAGIQHPKDFEGRRVGLRTWQATAGLWARGILQDEYDLDLKNVKWFTSDDESIEHENPASYDIERIPSHKNVVDMLLTGELDALIYPEMPDALLDGDDRIARLFADYKREEMDYYTKTRRFPIMHTVVIKQEHLERDPWIARNLLIAFRESKDLSIRKMRDPRHVSIAWLRNVLDEQQRVMGDDPWAYEFERNRDALETMIRYSVEQGIISHSFAAEDLFVPSTIGELPTYH